MRMVENITYEQHLATYANKNIHNGGPYPRIRTAQDQHATNDTDRKPVFDLIRKLHELKGCEAELKAPYHFLDDIGAILEIFEKQYSEKEKRMVEEIGRRKWAATRIAPDRRPS